MAFIKNKNLNKKTILLLSLFFIVSSFLICVPTSFSAPSSTTDSSPQKINYPSTSLVDVNNPNHPIWGGLDIIGNTLGLPSLDFATLVEKIIRVALSFTGVILFINIFYAGFLWMISGSNEEKTSTAKKIILNSVIGIIIIIFSYSITAFIIKTFLGTSTNYSDI